MKICRNYPPCPITAACSLKISQAKSPSEGKAPPERPSHIFPAIRMRNPRAWWLPVCGNSAVGHEISWRSSGHSGSKLSIPSCIAQQVAMITSQTSLLPPCQDRTDTLSLQYLPKCFKGQVTLKKIPSRTRTRLYPVLHQHRDKNTTVKELILPMWYFSLFYLSLSEVKECFLQHRCMLTLVYKA